MLLNISLEVYGIMFKISLDVTVRRARNFPLLNKIQDKKKKIQ